MLTAGGDADYLLPTMMMSASADAAEAVFLSRHTAPGGMRAGFQHYATLLADGEDDRAASQSKLPMPVLALNGERGIPQARTLGCVRQVAGTIETALAPGSGHTFARDNPAWVAERLTKFLAMAPDEARGALSDA